MRKFAAKSRWRGRITYRFFLCYDPCKKKIKKKILAPVRFETKQVEKSVFCSMRSLSDAPPFLFYNLFWLEDFGNEVISTRIVLDNEALGDAINSTDPGGILTRPSCVSITQCGIMNSQKYLLAASPACSSLVSSLVEPLFILQKKKGRCVQKLQLISIRVESGVGSEVTGVCKSVNSNDTSTLTANKAKMGMSTVICSKT